MAGRSRGRIPTDAPGRLVRMGLMGAGVVGRNTLAGIRKIGRASCRERVLTGV